MSFVFLIMTLLPAFYINTKHNLRPWRERKEQTHSENFAFFAALLLETPTPLFLVKRYEYKVFINSDIVSLFE